MEERGSQNRTVGKVVLTTIALAGLTFGGVVIAQPAWKVSDADGYGGGASSSPSGATLPTALAVASPKATSSVPTASAKPTPTAVATDATLVAEIITAQRVVDKFWGRHWSEYFPGKYTSPRIVGLYDGTSPGRPRCGTERLPALNASYCRPDDSLAWDVSLMTLGYKSGDSWPYLVIAHEWGHSIQARIGESLTLSANELQADCLAGAALFGAASDGDLVLESGDQKELASALSILADETSWTRSADHGDPFERIGAFDQGRQHGVTACIPDLEHGQLAGSRTYSSGVSVSVTFAGYRALIPDPQTGSAGRAAVFEVSVRNGSAMALDVAHMSKPAVRFGDKAQLAQPVPDPASVLGAASLGIVPTGETRSVLFGVVAPPSNGGVAVRVNIPGPNPETDWPSSFEGEV